MVNEIERNEVVDTYTYRLVLTHPYYPTLVELGLVRPFRIISPNCFINGQTKDGVSGYVGTGPWVLSEHKEKQYALFTANKNYWGAQPKLQAVRWRVMPDHQTIMLALQKGEIDLVFGADGDMLNMDAFNALQKEGKYATLISKPIASRAILLNAHQPVTKDRAVRMFAPLYLSNHCINSCVYCPYHSQNKNIARKKLTQEEVAREVIALQDMGHKRLALEAGEHPTMNPIEYILESIKTIYSIKHKNGAIRRVNVNIAATTVGRIHNAQGCWHRHIYSVPGNLPQAEL